MEFLLWLSLFIAFYAFFGYGILLFAIIKIKRLTKGKPVSPPVIADELPTCTLIVAAYNEEGVMEDKIQNSLALNYPAAKLGFLFITDGSADGTAAIVQKHKQIRHMHSDERKGKIAAVHRAMDTVTSE